MAGACVYGQVELPTPITVSANKSVDPEGFWKEVGDKLGAIYGDAFKDVEGPVSVPIKPSILPTAVRMQVGPKICGETLKQRAYRTAADASELYGGGGGVGDPGTGYGPGGGDGNPFQDCFNTSTTACTSAGGGPQHCEVFTSLECPGGIG